jgi:hypothetical protein
MAMMDNNSLHLRQPTGIFSNLDQPWDDAESIHEPIDISLEVEW